MVALNYTTSVPVGRTVAEVQALLGGHGAVAVLVRYAEREPVGVAFTLHAPNGGRDRAFTLPVDVDAVHRQLASREAGEDIRRRLRKNPAGFQSREHAARVAWRTAKDWLEAQLAMVAAQMVALDQVMLPYLVVDADETTLYQAYLRDDHRRALSSGVP